MPSRPGEDWRATWRERLDATPVWLVPWLRHQRDGAYWRQGSLAPAYDRIEAAMLLFGGWMDSYVDPVLRMLERCSAPRRAIVGNWSHEFPDDGYPGPNLDWLHEMVRFFDHWLKGEQNGVMEEPALTWFERDFAPPEAFPAHWPGRWRAAAAPPSSGVDEGAPIRHPLARRRLRAARWGAGRRAPRRSLRDDLCAPGDDGDEGWPVLGRRGRPEWAGARPAPR